MSSSSSSSSSSRMFHHPNYGWPLCRHGSSTLVGPPFAPAISLRPSKLAHCRRSCRGMLVPLTAFARSTSLRVRLCIDLSV